jgi:dTDP-4-amino-4,6-dideoxygalactose transaminase
MVDLQSQYHRLETEIDKGIKAVLCSGQFINGEPVKQFAAHLAAYLNVPYVIPCGNGTDALQISLMSLHLSPGDEVITTPFSFIAAAEAIALLNLTPVFVDVEADTFNIDISRIEQKITSRTKVLLPVHLFGQCCNMQSLLSFAGTYHLHVIEDACQSLGARYRMSSGEEYHAGTMGNIGCTSFFPSKNLGCYGDGGAIFTRDTLLADTAKSIASHGQSTRYRHDRIGMNSRLDSLQATILDIKLPYLDIFNERRRKIATAYNEAFAHNEHLLLPNMPEDRSHVFHQYTLRLQGKNREACIQALNEAGIPAMIYYPVPLHLQKVFANYGYRQGDFPVAEQLCQTVLSLPICPELDNQQLDYITDIFLKIIKKI